MNYTQSEENINTLFKNMKTVENTKKVITFG